MTISIDPCKDALAQELHRILASLADVAGSGVSIEDLREMIEKPPEDHMGDFSLPCFRFAKTLKLPPPKVAAILAEKLTETASVWIEKTAVLNAFLNIYVQKSQLAAVTIPKILDGSFFSQGVPAPVAQTRVMVEYSQPNTHKEFHVGHMRNVCLGSSLVALYRYCGYHVTAANYYGDEGAHIAKCLWMMKRLGASPAPSDDKGAWLGVIYAKAAQFLAAAEPAAAQIYDQEISAVLRGIESKSGMWFDLWLETRQWSLTAFHEVYRWIGAAFDTEFFESDVSKESQSIVDEYLAKGVFKVDQGAVGVDLSDYKLGFMLARKRDGNTLYATKDLALARHKFEAFNIDKNVYVVANEQNHHFKQVFKTLEVMGFKNASQCYHLSYGMVVGPEGKMSSRDGTAIPFMDLKDNMLREILLILAKYQGDWPPSEITDTAHKICVGAIKYGMLAADPAREIVFNMKDWLSFEGNTGPYLMYGYTRAASVLRKAKELGHAPWSPEESLTRTFTFSEPSEGPLLRSMYDFNRVVVASRTEHRPSHLCTHLYYMCKNFSRFYAEVPVLKSEDTASIAMRLAMIAAFQATLKQGLGLLGITPPERM